MQDFETKLKLAEQRAHQWHDGVTYGGGMVMTEQLFGTAEKMKAMYHGENVEEAIIASYLYKAQDTKRLNEATVAAMKEAGMYVEGADFQSKNPVKGNAAHNSYGAIAMDFSPTVAHIIRELSSEPEEDKTLSKVALWEDKTKWAQGLSKETQAILLAEKLQNFEVSRDKPNPKWEPKRHIEYYDTRMIMVEALKEASPELYQACVRVAEEGISVQKAKEAALAKALQNGGNGGI